MSAEKPGPHDALGIARLSGKSCDLLADMLRERILSGTLPPGAKLPTERELAAGSGLSRGSVREAIRVLNAEGLVEARLGRYGGTIVSEPGQKMIADVVNRFARGRKLSHLILHEAREALEPSVARLAAQRRSEADLHMLQALHADLAGAVEDHDRFVRLNVAWHAAIGAVSGNDLLASFLLSLASGFVDATDTDDFDTVAVRQGVVRIHARILAAIAAQDGDAAERRMRRHIRATRVVAQPSDASSNE